MRRSTLASLGLTLGLGVSMTAAASPGVIEPKAPVSGAPASSAAYEANAAQIELVYSTYLGGSLDEQSLDDATLTIDEDGNSYVVGGTTSTDFPTVNGSPVDIKGGLDAFVAKVSSDGSSLLFSLVLGGEDDDIARDVVLDAQGNIHIVGETSSGDFPVTIGEPPGLSQAAFIMKISPDSGRILYSRLLGGSSARAIDIDNVGNVVVSGWTRSPDFPLVNPYQSTFVGSPTDGFVVKLDSTGANILFSTFLGGNGQESVLDVVLDKDGNALITGYTASADFPTLNAVQPTFGGAPRDAFFGKMDPNGNMQFLTFVGGNGDDHGVSVDADVFGNIYVGGTTASDDLPVVNAMQDTHLGGLFDIYFGRLEPDGSAFDWLTYLGGNAPDHVHHIATDDSGYLHVTGHTWSRDWPVASQPFQAAHAGGNEDGYVLKVNPAGTRLLYSSYYGGNGEDRGIGIVVPRDGGDAYIVADTTSDDVVVANALQGESNGQYEYMTARVHEPGARAQVSLQQDGDERALIALSNRSASAVQVEMNVWLEVPGIVAPRSMLGASAPRPVLEPMMDPSTVLNLRLPAVLPFPGAAVGVRLIDPVTGALVSESIVATGSAVSVPDGPGIVLSIYEDGGQKRFRVAMSNPTATEYEVGIKAWAEVPDAETVESLVGDATVTYTVPPGSPLAQYINQPLPETLAFPGTIVGTRAVSIVTGQSFAKSTCVTVPCN